MILSFAFALAAAGGTSRGQDAGALAFAPPPEVVPTVTVATGDTGGTVFGMVPDPARTRRYYIAAEPGRWDYTPEGRDPICGKPLPPAVVLRRSGTKIRYVEYTDATFTTRVLENPRLGILGPVLRGVTGEFLAVTFLNRAMRPLSMHPHGVKYDKESEGAYYGPGPGRGAAVGPGATFTYVWELDEASGPLPHEPSSKAWLYHSHVLPDEEIDLGLAGFLVVTDPERARPDGTPVDVDREMASLFLIYDESGLGPEAKEAYEYAGIPGAPPALPWAETEELLERGKRYAINGRIFGNLEGLEMREGERVRWYTFGLGSETDLHTAHWHGERVLEDGRKRTDVVELFPASMKVADMVADNPGSWLFHCHVAEHMNEGMFARFIIHPRDVESDRPALAQPFFGLRPEQVSLRFRGAEARGGDAPLVLRGVVTTPNPFAVRAHPITVRIGGKSITFRCDNEGEATAEGGDATLKIWTPCEFGVVYGGLLDFEIRLRGEAWKAAVAQAGETEVSVELQVGKAIHHAPATFRVSGD